MAYADDFECDICDAKGPIVIICMPQPWSSINICGSCLDVFKRELGEESEPQILAELRALRAELADWRKCCEESSRSEENLAEEKQATLAMLQDPDFIKAQADVQMHIWHTVKMQMHEDMVALYRAEWQMMEGRGASA